MLDFGATWCSLVQLSAHGAVCRLVKFGADRFRLVPFDVDFCRIVEIGKLWRSLVHTDEVWCNLVQIRVDC